jgi:anti-sigma factor RsiW
MHPDDLILLACADNELDAGERAEVEQHLETCTRCRDIVAALVSVHQVARTLAPIDPPPQVWSRIAAGLESPSPRRVTWAAAIAASLVLVAAAGWFTRSIRHPDAPASAASDLASVESELREAEDHYQKAIAGLEAIATRDAGRLDPHVADTFSTNLRMVDQAIAESRAALASDPQSPLARHSLLDELKTKLGLLEDTVAAINGARDKG